MQRSFSDIICENTDIKMLQKNVFLTKDETNPFIPCNDKNARAKLDFGMIAKSFAGEYHGDYISNPDLSSMPIETNDRYGVWADEANKAPEEKQTESNIKPEVDKGETENNRNEPVLPEAPMADSLDKAKPDMAQKNDEVKNPIHNEPVPMEVPRIEPTKEENVPSTNQQFEGSEIESKSDTIVPIDMTSSYNMPAAERKDIHPEIISQEKVSPGTTGETIHETSPAPGSAMEPKSDTNMPIDVTASYPMPSAETKDIHPEIQSPEKESSDTTGGAIHEPLPALDSAMEPKPDANVANDMTSSYPMPSADIKDIHPEIQLQEKESPDTTRETIQEPLPDPQVPIGMEPELDIAVAKDRVNSYTPAESLHEPIAVEAPSSATTNEETGKQLPPGKETIDLVDDKPNEIKSVEGSAPLMEPTPSVDVTEYMPNSTPEEVNLVPESKTQNMEEQTIPPPSEIPTDQVPALSPY